MNENLQFVPFSSSFDLQFWQKLHEFKLKTLKLNDDYVQIKCAYNYARENSPPFMYFDANSLKSSAESENAFPCVCSLRVFNTLDDFKKLNKESLLESESRKLENIVRNDKWIRCVRDICPVILLSFVELKTYVFNYWAVFPTVRLNVVPKTIKPMESLGDEKYKNMVNAISAHFGREKPHTCCFGVDQDSLQIFCLDTALDRLNKGNRIILACANPSCIPCFPGWPIRNLLIYVGLKCKSLPCLTLIGLTGSPNSKSSLLKSNVYFVSMEFAKSISFPMRMLGFELDSKGKERPRSVNLRQHLDPLKLANTANSLNLRLMKWRLAPELDLDQIEKIKCLLIGAGTLGCNAARCLMGWNVKQISFIDNGVVSLSSPIRQSLYTFEDCSGGTRIRKVDAAVRRCKEIDPSLHVQGYFLTIPSPGIPISDNEREARNEDLKQIEQLIENHDVVMLLTDTRSSRWLPTVVGSAKRKLILTAALGFDSFLVMRHGNAGGGKMRLGCYFCSDVTAPSEMKVDRSIDQRCTVTRPGLSMMASSMLVELLVNLLHHQAGKEALAEQGSIGHVPHTIRGFLNSFSFCSPTVSQFEHCIACAEPVLDNYLSRGIEFLCDCLDNPEYIEKMSGVDEMRKLNDDDFQCEEFS